MTAFERLKNAQTVDGTNAVRTSSANAFDRLRNAQTVDDGVQITRPTQEALNKASQVSAAALTTKEAERKMEQLQNQRRQAQVDLDTAAINRIDAQLKQIRAERGEQTAADRMGDIVGAAASNLVGSTANAVGTAINAYNDPDSNRRRAESLRKVLETGYTTDGKAITPTMRYNIARQIADLNADANRWERKDSAHNQLYGFADTVAKDTEQFTSSAKEGLSGVGKFAVDAGIAGTQLATDVAASALVPGSGLFLMGTRAFGGGAQEARQDGASIGEQVAYGAGSAATSMLTEKLFNVAGPYAKAFGNGFFDKLVSRATKTAAGKMLLSALSEGGEEALESVIQPFLKNLTYSEGEKIKWDDVGYDALIGGLLGLVGGAGDVMTATPRNATQTPSDAIVAATRGVGTSAKNVPQEASVGAADTVAKPVNPFAKQMKPQAKNTDPIAKAMVGKPAQETAVQQNEHGAVGAAEQGFESDFSRLQNQSTEFHPAGANPDPTRSSEVPKVDFDGRNISQAASTVAGASAIPNSQIPTVEQMIADGLLSYDVKTDADALANADNTIKDIGWDGAVQKLRNAVQNGYTSKDMTVLAEKLLVNAANAQDGKSMAEILSLYQTMRTNTGQAMQAGTLLRKMSPEWQLYGIQRSVANLKNELETKYKKTLSDVQVSDALVQKFLEQTDQNGRDAVMDEIYKDVARQVPATWMDKWNAWRYLSMLANPKTHIRNVVGNVGFQPVRIIKNEIASVIEGLVSASGKDIERTKSFAASPALYRAAWNDFDNVSDLVEGNRYESANSKIMQEREIFKFKPLEATRKGNSKLLEIGDAIFKRITYADSLAQYLKANGITAASIENGTADKKVLTSARNYAAKEALKATYQDSNAISDATERAVKGMGVFGEAVMPFKRTPANVLARALEYSPAGLAKSLTADLVRVKKGNLSASQAIDNIASGMTGTGLFALGAYLFANGLVTGAQGDDEEDTWRDLLGHQGYALELDDGTSVTLDWLSPESLPFFMGVELMSSIGENGFQPEDIMDTLLNVSEPMLEMSMLQSVNDMIDSVSYADSSQKIGSLVSSAIIGYFSQAIPTIGGQFERTGEDIRMTTYTDKNKSMPSDIQYALGKASAKLPGVDYAQIPYIDAWGRTESTGTDPMVRAANNFVNPAYMSKVEVDAVEKELQRVFDAVGTQYGSVFPDRAEKSFDVSKKVYDAQLGEEVSKKERKNLTADEYVKYAKAKGENSYKLVQQAIKSPAYKSMRDGERAKYISAMYEYANYKAKKSVAPNLKSDVHAKYEEAERNGITPAEFYVHRTTTSDMEAGKDKNGKSINGSKKEKVIDYINSSNFSRVEKDWLYLLDYSSDDHKKNKQNLKELPWNK